MCYASLNQRPRKNCNCAILDVTVKKILITAFLKKLPFLAKGLMRRTLYGFHCNIMANVMVAGHTKFAPDWCFGLLTQKYRRTPVSCLEDIARVTNTSTLTGVNLAQLVGPEDQSEVHVPLYNWQTFLSGFKPLAGMKQYQHFR